MLKKTEFLLKRWPGGFNASDEVRHQGRLGRVLALPPAIVPRGRVPVRYEGETKRFAMIPADDLNHLLTETPER